ncbi:MAG: type IV secretion system DNA-binding domain-containing protein [Candidatus Moranbacteria bacterium]|nr:type IV secretion system DNA-binding domain-containing protein [Candidatus Moranbacteria bacterium]
MSNINFFAKTNFRNQERVFGIKEDDRRRHMYIIGKTGMGKSNLLENMAIQDIRNGKGVCVVDPHGEFAEKMLRAVPANRINDVVYFNPSDIEFPVAFNILEAVDEDKKNLVASGMMGVFKKIWPDVWSSRMEYILNNAILALLDYPGSTLLGVNRMMSDKDYRKRVYTKITDPVVKAFWINEFDKWEDKFRKEAVAAIQNKVGQFLSYTLVRHIIGQPKSTIDMREIMDNQKILIVNLSKGRIGEDAMRLLGGMIITKIQLAAMSRVDIPENERKDFYLYVDEFQNFATESFSNILSEARKYRLALILAHQYINQLVFDGNTTVKDAIFGNVGTLVSFRVGAEDAEHLEKEFDPVFLMNDIVNLSKYDIYLKLMIDGIAGDAFSAQTLPPADISDTIDAEQKVIAVSRERYGKSRTEVAEKIARWSGMDVGIGFDEFAPANDQKENKVIKIEKKQPRVEKNISVPTSAAAERVSLAENNCSQERQAPVGTVQKETALTQETKPPMELFEAFCSTCEEKITVPFKPDPSRKTFCKECLRDYQRARAKAQLQRAPIVRDEVKNRSQAAPMNRENFNVSHPAGLLHDDGKISLNQIANIAPKKFKAPRKELNLDKEGIRNMINSTKNNG